MCGVRNERIVGNVGDVRDVGDVGDVRNVRNVRNVRLSRGRVGWRPAAVTDVSRLRRVAITLVHSHQVVHLTSQRVLSQGYSLLRVRRPQPPPACDAYELEGLFGTDPPLLTALAPLAVLALLALRHRVRIHVIDHVNVCASVRVDATHVYATHTLAQQHLGSSGFGGAFLRHAEIEHLQLLLQRRRTRRRKI